MDERDAGQSQPVAVCRGLMLAVRFSLWLGVSVLLLLASPDARAADGAAGRRVCCNNVPHYAETLRDVLHDACNMAPPESRVSPAEINEAVESFVRALKRAADKRSDGCSSHRPPRRLAEVDDEDGCLLGFRRFRGAAGCAPVRDASREFAAALAAFLKTHPQCRLSTTPSPSLAWQCPATTTEPNGGKRRAPTKGPPPRTPTITTPRAPPPRLGPETEPAPAAPGPGDPAGAPIAGHGEAPAPATAAPTAPQSQPAMPVPLAPPKQEPGFVREFDAKIRPALDNKTIGSLLDKLSWISIAEEFSNNGALDRRCSRFARQLDVLGLSPENQGRALHRCRKDPKKFVRWIRSVLL
jgi:hypothetical protein